MFRSVDTFAAGLLAVFGMVNAVAIMGIAAPTVQLLYVASGHLWGVGAMFFGLWLIPMGWLVLRSRWLPRPLGWVLIAGGVGYLVSAFVTYFALRRNWRRPAHQSGSPFGAG